jgi:hypothetical protein
MLTFNGGGAAASVVSGAIFLVTKREDVLTEDSEAVTGNVITVAGKDFVAAASEL